MGIIKNEIPILEFDTDREAVLSPTHDHFDLKLPEKCVFAFLGGYMEEYAAKVGAKQVSCFVNATKNYPVYVTEYKGEEIVLCQAPVGAAAAVQLLDWLIGFVKSFRQAAAAHWNSWMKAYFLYPARLCVMKEHPITMLRPRALSKSTKEQEKPLKRQYLSTT